MLQLFLIHPGATDFDRDGRIKGSLDIPLNPEGETQVDQICDDLARQTFDAIYAGPCGSAQQTAAALATCKKLRVRTLDDLRNMDHGLWHGKRIDEVKRGNPKLYRLGQDHPELICPPQGESLSDARERVLPAVRQILRRHKRGGTIAVVVSDPLASLMSEFIAGREFRDLWKAECDVCRCEVFQFEPAEVLAR